MAKKEKLPPICHGWREQAARRKALGLDDSVPVLTTYGSHGNGGISFQEPKGWTDGKPGLKYVEKGPHKGRLRWETRREAKELAKRLADAKGRQVEYDP